MERPHQPILTPGPSLKVPECMHGPYDLLLQQIRGVMHKRLCNSEGLMNDLCIFVHICVHSVETRGSHDHPTPSLRQCGRRPDNPKSNMHKSFISPSLLQ